MSTETAVHTVSPSPNFEALLSAAMQSNMSAAVVALVQLRSEEAATARKVKFAEALCAFQGEMPFFQKTKAIKDKQGNDRSWYAPHDLVMKEVQPLLKKHGLSLLTTTRYGQSEPFLDPKSDRMIVIKTVTAYSRLMHVSGYESAPHEFTAIIDDEAFMSTTQKAGAAATYATNQAELLALGVVKTDVPVGSTRTDDRQHQRQHRPQPAQRASSEQAQETATANGIDSAPRGSRPTATAQSSGYVQNSQGSTHASSGGSAQTEAPSANTETPLPKVTPNGSAQQKAKEIIDHINDLPVDGFLIRNLRAAKKVAHEHFGEILPEVITAALKPRFKQGDELAKSNRPTSRNAA